MQHSVEPAAPLILDALLDPAAHPDTAAELEAAGFGAAWVTETVRDPFICLAGAAGTTSRMRLATGVAIAFGRSPMTTALSAHDIQRLSGGRLMLGLGSQVRSHITRRFSMPWSQPGARMREYVLAVRAIWSSWNDEAPLDFAGEFYTHTLMTPFFNPGPTGFANPPVILGGVGGRMTEMAGEVADGFLCGPLTSELSFREHTLPALDRGLGMRQQPTTNPFEVSVMPLVVTGSDAVATERVAQATRGRIAFYASTPAYRHILELHGWGKLHDRLLDLSRQGGWAQMADLIDDDVLQAFAVVAEPREVAGVLRARFGGAAARAVIQGAADLDPEVWRAIAEGAVMMRRSGAGAS